jgi:hypothetical protein
MTGTLSGTYLKSAFMTGVIGGANLSRDFADGKFQAGFGYRYVGYKLPESSLDINQNIAEVNLSVMLRKLLLSVNYEGTFEKSDMYNRIYLQARIRF